MKNFVKMVRGLYFTLMVGMLFIGNVFAADDMVNAIKNRGDGSELKSYSGVVTGSVINSEYGFALSAQKGTTVTFSGQQAIPSDIREYFANPSDGEGASQCLNQNGGSGETIAKTGYSAYYSNVGVYNDMIIDVKATVVDFEESKEDSEFNLRFKDNNGNVVHKSLMRFGAGLNLNVDNVRYAKIKFEFFDHNTKKPVTVKGNTTYWDVDARQGILMHDNNKGLYVSNSNNTLRINSALGGKYVFSTYDGDDRVEKNTNYAFSEIFEGTSITRTFTFSAFVDNAWKFGSGFMALSGDSVVPAESPAPSKKVSKSEVRPGEEYTYTITQKVNQAIQANYFKAFRIEDTLENVLEANQANVSVKNSKGEDVTSNFDITVSGQKITVAAKADIISNAAFYGDTYSISIKTKIKENADLSSYTKDNGFSYVIPNQASLVYTDYNNTEKTIKTKIVNVTYKKYKLIVHHYLEGTTQKLAEDESYIKEYNDKYSTNRSSEISAEYELVGTPENASGTITKDTEVIYYYKKSTGLIVDVPKTAAFMSSIALVLSVVAIGGSAFVIYDLVRKKKMNK